MKPASRDDKPAFVFMHDKPAPAPLQLERIEEDATLRGAHAGGFELAAAWRVIC